ncbi:hypothetical protein [Fischerella sp. NIES-3754]|uniref:hypothetical protein n=1 Tax=Fischerella sp. NIES-3754 TaxID=1752063 RepID=UPI000AC6D1DC|nr:hypothetical protein [Fischerella sp. NIES-3754]
MHSDRPSVCIGVHLCSIFKNISFQPQTRTQQNQLCTAIAHRCASVYICVRYSKIYLPSHRLELNKTNHAQRSLSVCICVKFFEIVARWEG